MKAENQNRLVLLAVAFSAGFIAGLVLAPGGNRHNEGKNRAGANFVFGNIIIGSFNGFKGDLAAGYDDSGDNR